MPKRSFLMFKSSASEPNKTKVKKMKIGYKSDKELVRLIKWQGSLCCNYGSKRINYISKDFIKIKKEEEKHYFNDGCSFNEGFRILKNSVIYLKILNYRQNNFHIKSLDDILLMRIIYMELFKIIDDSLKELGISEKYLNYWLLSKIGKKDYINRLKYSQPYKKGIK